MKILESKITVFLEEKLAVRHGVYLLISDIVFDLYSKTLFCKVAFITNCIASFFCAYLVFVDFDSFGGYSKLKIARQETEYGKQKTRE